MFKHVVLHLSAAAIVLSGPAVAVAHPGHGAIDPASFAHLLLEPEHAVWLLALTVAAAASRLIGARRNARRDQLTRS